MHWTVHQQCQFPPSSQLQLQVGSNKQGNGEQLAHTISGQSKQTCGILDLWSIKTTDEKFDVKTDMRLTNISLLFWTATYTFVVRPVGFTSSELCWMNRRMCLVIMATIAGISPEPFFRIQKSLSICSPNRMGHLFMYNSLSQRTNPCQGKIERCANEK
jgi:hypothetical protein